MNKEIIDMLIQYKIQHTIRGKKGFEAQGKYDEEEKKDRKRAYNMKQSLDPAKQHAKRVKDAARKRDKNANMSMEEKEMVRKKDRERKALLSKSCKDSEKGKEKHKIEIAALRNKYTNAEKEFERLKLCLRMRKVRERRSDNELHLENLLAKNGMRTLRQLGNLKKFQQRNPRELDDETLWYRFWLKGIEYKEILRTKLPEVSKLFIEESRPRLIQSDSQKEQSEQKLLQIEKEKQEREQERRDGIWEYNPEDDCYYWTGDGPSPCSFDEYNGLREFAPPDRRKVIQERTPEEWEEIRKYDEFQSECYKSWFNEMAEQERQERNRNQRERRAKIKEKLRSPINLPETELSEYEKLREKNMKEIEEFKKASGLFE